MERKKSRRLSRSLSKAFQSIRRSSSTIIKDIPLNLIQHQIKSITSEKVWIEDSDRQIWKLYHVVKQEKGDLYLRDVTNSREMVINLAFADVHPAALMDSPLASDMITLRYLNEPTILFNLKERYLKRLPYTYMGSILITANPFEWYLNSSQTAHQFIGKPCDPDNPHPYAIAGLCLFSLLPTLIFSSPVSRICLSTDLFISSHKSKCHHLRGKWCREN
jgi:myosin heavy subunit